MFQRILQVGSARVQTVREMPLAPMETLRWNPKEARLPEHVGCSGVERVGPLFPHPAHALASPMPGKVRRASECEFLWVDERLGREVEIKVDDSVLVVHIQEWLKPL